MQCFTPYPLSESNSGLRKDEANNQADTTFTDRRKGACDGAENGNAGGENKKKPLGFKSFHHLERGQHRTKPVNDLLVCALECLDDSIIIYVQHGRSRNLYCNQFDVMPI